MATAPKENKTKGLLYTLPVTIIGIVLWVLLWSWGFIASAVAWLIAAGTIKMYRKGAGGISRSSVPLIVTSIIITVLLAFIAGMASDAVAFYGKEIGSLDTMSILASVDFWNFFLGSLLTADLWGSYFTDLLVALGFGVLGAYGDIRSLFAETKTKPKRVMKTA